MLCQGGCGADYGADCAHTEPCTCTHDFSKTQIQIVEYNAYQPGKLNRGVRALQAFEMEAVIGEYVGKFVPPQMVDEETLTNKDYILDMEAFVDGQTGHTPVIAGISAAREGNWTRFINHREKNWNVEFENMVIKDKHRICIRVVKDVKFGEQIFTNYGRKYFK
jgi:SET domain-containing protein